MAVQKNTWSYAEQTLSDDFIPFTIEAYGYFHPHFDSFLVACAQTIIVCH
jgi:hypothetical protein